MRTPASSMLTAVRICGRIRGPELEGREVSAVFRTRPNPETAAAAPATRINVGRSPEGSRTVAGDEPEAPKGRWREVVTPSKASEALSPTSLRVPSAHDRAQT